MNTRNLKRLKVSNFQSHSKTEIDFVDGINVITGLEDSGKTAVLRAINWLRGNKPSGDGFRHNKDKSLTVEVEMEFADGVIVNHSLSKANSYSYMNPKAGSDEPGSQLFTKVGREVPAPISEKLCLDEINIQEQFDQPYLVWLTSGELANVFNKLSGMQRFDEWQSRISSGIKVANLGIKSAVADIDSSQQLLLKFEKLPAVKKMVTEIDQLDRRIAEAGRDFNKLRQVEAEIKAVESKMNKLAASEEEVARAGEITRAAKEFDSQIISVSSKLSALREVITEMDTIMLTEEELAAATEDYLNLLSKLGICDRCYSKIDQTTVERIKERMASDD